jgi:hypothetical protein
MAGDDEDEVVWKAPGSDYAVFMGWAYYKVSVHASKIPITPMENTLRTPPHRMPSHPPAVYLAHPAGLVARHALQPIQAARVLRLADRGRLGSSILFRWL